MVEDIQRGMYKRIAPDLKPFLAKHKWKVGGPPCEANIVMKAQLVGSDIHHPCYELDQPIWVVTKGYGRILPDATAIANKKFEVLTPDVNQWYIATERVIIEGDRAFEDEPIQNVPPEGEIQSTSRLVLK